MYTILHDKTKLEQKKWEKMQKSETDADLPWGMGSGLERAYSKWLFFIKGYNIRKIIEKFPWFLYQMNPMAYKVQQ